jgi:signal transduction histidine kinase
MRVADTGTGIPVALRHRVFELFMTTKGGAGTGIGLSICQGLIRSHGGDVTIDDAPGGGACVTVRLPVLATAVSPARPVAPMSPVHEVLHG